MLFIYNFIQITIPLICLPCLLVLLLYVYMTPKYRGRMTDRLGIGLAEKVSGISIRKSRIWIHALSVGEVSSARVLIKRLRNRYPDAILILSASTSSGVEYAVSTLKNDIDLFTSFPFDLYWSTEKFIQTINPDIFILVETDLWPNFLGSVRRHNVKSVLVNGRMSEESFNNYKKFSFFFTPMLNTFEYLTLQTDEEMNKMLELGVDEKKLKRLGNMKYDGLVGENGNATIDKALAESAEGKMIWVAGSTHSGEEEIILDAFMQLRKKFPALYLVLAPRNVERGDEISIIAKKLGLLAERRSKGGRMTGDMLILDTLGALAALYGLCEVAFVGGSLVEQRGHNPLEPAAYGKPVIFGPHMEDFQEISADLIKSGGAVVVSGVDEIVGTLDKWLSDDKISSDIGDKGKQLVKSMRGVTDKHLDLIETILRSET